MKFSDKTISSISLKYSLSEILDENQNILSANMLLDYEYPLWELKKQGEFNQLDLYSIKEEGYFQINR